MKSMADLMPRAGLSASRDKIYAGDPTRDVDVIPVVFNFDLVKFRSFRIPNGKQTLMESILDCKKMVPVHLRTTSRVDCRDAHRAQGV